MATISALTSRAIVTTRPARVTSAAARAATVVVRASAEHSVTLVSFKNKAHAVVAKASPVLRTAGLATLVSLALASPAHADAIEETSAFLKAFWEFRTGDPASFLALTVLPIAGPYVIFQFLIDKKVVVRREELRAGGWYEFMAERGLDADALTLQQLNAFCAAAEKDLLDDGMVVEFVRQIGLDEQWIKSTIDVEDPRLEKAKQRARAEKIIAMKEAAAMKETTSAN